MAASRELVPILVSTTPVPGVQEDQGPVLLEDASLLGVYLLSLDCSSLLLGSKGRVKDDEGSLVRYTA